MGLLIDIRSGKRAVTGPGAIIFWFAAGIAAAGTALGFGLPQTPANPSPDGVAYLLTLIGALVGMAVGFYAAWGTSLLARALAIPGVIVDLLIELVT
jgi:hypothetical protein